jgi:hypothetical protein
MKNVGKLTFKTINSVVLILLQASSASAVDLDPQGSALILVVWIRIQVVKNTH